MNSQILVPFHHDQRALSRRATRRHAELTAAAPGRRRTRRPSLQRGPGGSP